VADDLGRAALPGELAGDPALLLERGHRAAVGPVPIGLVDVRTARIRPDALETGSVAVVGSRLELLRASALEPGRLVAMAPLADRTYQGAATSFVLERERFVRSPGDEPVAMALDFDDGAGFRPVRFGQRVDVRWATPGRKTITLRLEHAGGQRHFASAAFDVRALGTPMPDDTLQITATVPWEGALGTGQAYVYLAPGHAQIENPLVLFEGFDISDTMFWEELYELLNQENLIEDLRADGYDAVVLNYSQATVPIPRNAFVAVETIEQVKSFLPPEQDLFVVGASMGGLVGRYALAWMEQQGMDHRTRSFLAFDTPHDGANIPLGIQYWLDFFSPLSSEAAFLLSRLDTPAARQMLVLHHTTPPDGTPEPDPRRPQFLAELDAVGTWPAQPRLLGITNGSAAGLNQGFEPGDQVIRYEYGSFLVDIVGNVWAIPPLETSDRIFRGEIDYLIGTDRLLDVIIYTPNVYDGAPGGWRASMAEMDAVPAPYGDIIALYPNHCFVPAVSALALGTDDLFFDLDGTPDLASLTPFDAVYFPPSGPNQEHVTVTADLEIWIRAEIDAGATDGPVVAGGPPVTLQLAPPFPNPARGAATVRFATPRPGPARVDVYDVRGRLVETLLDGRLDAGAHAVRWPGAAASGVYWIRLRTDDGERSARLVVTR
jgi:hypothetical protein